MARKYNCKTQHTSFSFSYLSQVWHLSDNSTHKISVAWDNFFRCVFHVVVETVLNYYIIFSPHSEYRISAVQICLLEKKVIGQIIQFTVSVYLYTILLLHLASSLKMKVDNNGKLLCMFRKLIPGE